MARKASNRPTGTNYQDYILDLSNLEIPQQQMQQTPAAEEAGTWDKIVGTGQAIAEGITMFPGGLLDTVRDAWSGGEIDVSDREGLEARRAREAERAAYARKYEGKAFGGVTDAMTSMPYSLATMGATLGAGLAAAPAGPVAAGAAGMAASGTVAYRASKQQFLQQMLEQTEKALGRMPTQEEWDRIATEFDDEATRYGAWEAGPEAASNLLMAKLLGPLGKGAVKGVMGKVLRGVGLAGEELGTETLTELGQGHEEARAGLREAAPGVVEAFTDVAPATLWQTALMAGGHKVAGKIYNRMKANREVADTEQRIEDANAATQENAGTSSSGEFVGPPRPFDTSFMNGPQWDAGPVDVDTAWNVEALRRGWNHLSDTGGNEPTPPPGGGGLVGGIAGQVQDLSRQMKSGETVNLLQAADNFVGPPRPFITEAEHREIEDFMRKADAAELEAENEWLNAEGHAGQRLTRELLQQAAPLQISPVSPEAVAQTPRAQSVVGLLENPFPGGQSASYLVNSNERGPVGIRVDRAADGSQVVVHAGLEGEGRVLGSLLADAKRSDAELIAEFLANSGLTNAATSRGMTQPQVAQGIGGGLLGLPEGGGSAAAPGAGQIPTVIPEVFSPQQGWISPQAGNMPAMPTQAQVLNTQAAPRADVAAAGDAVGTPAPAALPQEAQAPVQQAGPLPAGMQMPAELPAGSTLPQAMNVMQGLAAQQQMPHIAPQPMPGELSPTMQALADAANRQGAREQASVSERRKAILDKFPEDARKKMRGWPLPKLEAALEHYETIILPEQARFENEMQHANGSIAIGEALREFYRDELLAGNKVTRQKGKKKAQEIIREQGLTVTQEDLSHHAGKMLWEGGDAALEAEAARGGEGLAERLQGILNNLPGDILPLHKNMLRFKARKLVNEARRQQQEQEGATVGKQEQDDIIDEITPERAAALNLPQAGNILLRASDLAEIERKHSKEFKQAGFTSARDFINYVLEDVEAAYKVGGKAYSLVRDLDGKRSGQVVAELEFVENDGTYRITTAHIVRSGYFKNKQPLSERAHTNRSSNGTPSATWGESGLKNNVDETAPAVKPTHKATSDQRQEILAQLPEDLREKVKGWELPKLKKVLEDHRAQQAQQDAQEWVDSHIVVALGRRADEAPAKPKGDIKGSSTETPSESASPASTDVVKSGQQQEENHGRADDTSVSQPANRPVVDESAELVDGVPAERADGAVEHAEPSGASGRPGQVGGDGGQDTGDVRRAPGGRDRGVRGRGDMPGGDGLPGRTAAGRGDGRNPDVGEQHQGTRGQGSRNHVIADGDVVVPGGAVARAKANIAAIKLVKQLEKEGREATPEEKKVLTQFTGWGSLAQTVFNPDMERWIGYEKRYGEMPSYLGDKFKTDFQKWKKNYGEVLHPELGGLMTEEEWEAAKKSTLNAHYTDRKVISAMWKMAERLGFKGGRVLEPSAGTGLFFGLMPQHISQNSHLMGVELDNLTGKILSHLYPDADIQITGYEAAKRLGNNTVDLVISNVPFGDFKVFDPKRPQYKDQSIHNYFFSRSLDTVKPGGLVMQITSHFTMDSVNGGKLREEWAKKADLVAAVRLPGTAFEKNAGTQVTTDILIFRKKSDGAFNHGQVFRNVKPVETKEGEASVNEYFVNHPENVLGTHSLQGSMYGGNEYTLLPPKEDLGDALDRVAESLPENVFGAQAGNMGVTTQGLGVADVGAKEGALVEKDGEPAIVTDGRLVAPTWKGAKKKEAAKHYLQLKDVTSRLVSAMNEDKDNTRVASLQKELNEIYDVFSKHYGAVGSDANKFLQDDIEFPTVAALENVETRIVQKSIKSGPHKGKKRSVKEKVFTKADIFTKRTVFPFTPPEHADSAADAVKISRIYKNGVDLPYISDLLSMTPEEAREAMLESGDVFEDPETGLLVARDMYLSGNVRDKLLAAQRAGERYKGNVTALEAVQPARVPVGHIHVRLGSTWTPPVIIENFLRHLGVAHPSVEVSKTPGDEGGVSWRVYGYGASGDALGRWRTQSADVIRLVDDCMNLRRTQISYKDSDGKTVKDEQATMAAQDKQRELQEEFAKWVKDDPDASKEIEDVYNEVFNKFVVRTFEVPDIKHYPGASQSIELRDNQKQGVSRALQESCLLAHGVGSGKTMLQITLAMEMRRLGTARKPWIVVQGSTLSQFATTFKQLYPAAKILAPNEEQRKAVNRQRLLAQIASGDWDAIITPHGFFNGLSVSPSTESGFLNEMVKEYEDIIADEKNGNSLTVKQAKKKMERLKVRLQNLANNKKDTNIYFDDLGIDALIIDEAHAYKRGHFVTNMDNVKGLDRDSSQRSFQMLMKSRLVQQKTGGKNVVLATGTPISNTLTEMWTMFRYTRPDLLEQFGVTHFDDFATTFASTTVTQEETATGEWKDVERFNKYVNGPELLNLWRMGADVVITEDLTAIKNMPKLKGGKIHDVTVPRSEALANYIENLRQERLAWDKLGGQEKRKQAHVPLQVYTRAKKAAIDLRLVESQMPDTPDSKANVAVENIVARWKEHGAENAAQIVFCDIYQSGDKKFNLFKDIKEKLIARGIPANEIAIIHDYKTDAAREALFSAVNSGDVRVLMGTTEKLGVGVNVQERLVTAHHLDAPQRPMDFEQRNGRIRRPGNIFSEVEILTYGTKNTLDSVTFQQLISKQKFINQLLRGNVGDRSFENPFDSTQGTFEDMLAAFSGNPLAKEKMKLTAEVRRLTALYDAFRTELHSKRHSIAGHKSLLEKHKASFADEKAKTAFVEKYFPDFTIPGKKELAPAIDAFIRQATKEIAAETKGIRSETEWLTKNRDTYNRQEWFDLPHGMRVAIRVKPLLRFDEGKVEFDTTTDYALQGPDKLFRFTDNFNGVDGLYTRMGNKLKELASAAQNAEARIKHETEAIAALEKALKAGFPQKEELEVASARLAEVERELEKTSKVEENPESDESAAVEEDPFASLNPGEHLPSVPAARHRGVRREMVQAVADKLHSTAKNAAQTHVVRGFDELPTHLRDALKGQEKTLEGVFDPRTGTVWLVANNLTGTERAAEVWAHEQFVHHGLRSLLSPAARKRLLNGLWLNMGGMGNATIREIAKRYGIDPRSDVAARQTVMEEVLASMAEKRAQGLLSGTEQSVWRKIVNAVLRAWEKIVERVTGQKTAMKAQNIDELITALGRHVMDGFSGGVSSMYAQEAALPAIRTTPPPRKTIKAYKLFRVRKDQPGKLFPLFVGANEAIEMGVWLDAEIGPDAGSGKVKSKLGPLAMRPGWHAGDTPIATHIGEKASPNDKKPSHRADDQVWAEVEVADDVDWQTEANNRASRTKEGKILPRTAHITDRVPVDGMYRYKTNPNMTGEWIISGAMRVNRLLSDAEVERINKEHGVADLPRRRPFDPTEWGFDSWERGKAEEGRQAWEQLQRDTEEWGRQVDAFDPTASGPGGQRALLTVATTPDVLQKLGAPNLPMTMEARNLAKILSDKEDHGLSKDLVKQLPRALAEPIMVFESATKADAFVVLTEIKNNGRNVMAAIHLDNERQRIRVNDVASAYSRNSSWYVGQIEAGRLLYQDKKKSLAWARTNRLQLPKVRRLPARLSEGRILTEGDIVKPSMWENDDTAPRASLAAQQGPAAATWNEHVSDVVRGLRKIMGRGVSEDVEEMIRNEREYARVMPKEDITLAERLLGKVAHWIAKNHPEFARLYNRQLRRQEERTAASMAAFESMPLLYGGKNRLNDAEMKQLQDMIWQWDGTEIISLRGIDKFTELEESVNGRPQLEKNAAYDDAFQKWLDRQPQPKRVREAYGQVRKALDNAFLQAYNKMARMSEIADTDLEMYRTEFGHINNYFPHRREGKYYITAKIGKDTVFRQHFDVPLGSSVAEEWAKIKAANMKKYPDAVWSRPGENEKLPEDILGAPIDPQAMEQIINAATQKLDSETADQVRATLLNGVSDILKARGWGAHGIRRQAVDGFMRDDIKGTLHSYINGLNGWLTKMDAAHDFAQGLGKIDAKATPRLWNYASQYVKDVLRNSDRIDQIAGNVKGLAFAWYLGASIKTAAINATQNFVVGVPRLQMYVEGGGFRWLKGAMDTFGMSYGAGGIKHARNLSADEQAMLNELYGKGIIADAYMQEIREQIGNNPATRMWDKFTRVLGIPMSFVEYFNRASLALAAYRAARAGAWRGVAEKELGMKKGRKMTHEEAQEFAAMIVRDSHYEYGRHNMPELFRSTAAGRAFSPAYTFRSFTVNTLNLWARGLAQEGVEGKKFVAKCLGATIALGGLTSFPLYATFAALAAMMSDDDEDMTVKLRRVLPQNNMLRDVACYGLPAMVGVNLGGSLKMETPFTESMTRAKTFQEAIMQSIGGVIGIPYDMAVEKPGRVLTALKYGNEYKAVEALVPTFMSNMMQAYRLATEGQTTKTGRPINSPGQQGARTLSPWEAAGKAMGFQPVSSTKSYDAYRASQLADGKRSDMKNELALHVLESMDSGKPDGRITMMRKLREWNKKMLAEGKQHLTLTPKEVYAMAKQRRRQNRRTPKQLQKGEAQMALWGI